ncbi:MAG TPA: GDP-mannose 4,6-dehydratase [Acidisoma sp.]|jgi:GDP-4-dehydro-6-deoxy-D-mannose reductase|uniref:GDP-mannose 4,6-dehydratase n=1 Tax=Acidisoma sp. TaxID=1872115 RepID=UPI002BB9680E|nr:GDP-mannose 4,6-dehydratase [Acidisoma sp.]HTH99452.1 GDP-mannose 4,6-dehydratase [Acidisoma sp.]
MRTHSRLLVTGADGFVGRHLVPLLRKTFPTATLIAATRQADPAPRDLAVDAFLPFDLLQPDQCKAMIATARPDGLVHLAAQASVASSFNDPLASWRANLVGTLALAEAVLSEAPQCRFVLASSAEVYGLSFRAAEPLDEGALLRPANPYAASKAACDIAVGEMALRGLDAIRLRAFNHTGAGQSENFVIAAFARQLARIEAGVQDPVMHVGALTRWRDFLDVSDVCAAYAAALGRELQPGAVYNIASETPRSIGDILDTMIAQSVVKPRVEVEAGRLRPTDVERVVGSSALARRELHWAPQIPWNQTVAAVLEDWRVRIRA